VVCLNHESGSDVEEPAHTYRPDDLFGELAMLYNAPRTATCCAASDCRLYALDRKAYKFILMKTSIQRQSQNKALLQNVDILKQLTETELLEMSDAMLEVAYENGDVVCRQGDMGLIQSHKLLLKIDFSMMHRFKLLHNQAGCGDLHTT